MTLLYGDRYIAAEAIGPIGWSVFGFGFGFALVLVLVLVRNVVGESKPVELGGSALQRRRSGIGDW